LPTIKIYKLENCIIILILFKNINKILLKNINIYIIVILTKLFILNKVNFINLIILENKKQKLGKEKSKLIIFKTIFNKIIFLKTILIKKNYKFVIFIYKKQYKIINFL